MNLIVPVLAQKLDQKEIEVPDEALHCIAALLSCIGGSACKPLLILANQLSDIGYGQGLQAGQFAYIDARKK